MRSRVFISAYALCYIVQSVTALRPVRPWEGSGYTGKIKPFTFSANTSGLDEEGTLMLASRYALVGYGWQQGWDGVCNAIGRGEGWGIAALTHAYDFMSSWGGSKSPAERGNAAVLCTYRHAQIAQRLWAQSALAAGNPSLTKYWLQNGFPCFVQQPWGTADPLWNFSLSETQDYWIAHTIDELVSTSVLAGGAVLLDAADRSVCGNGALQLGGCDVSRFDNNALARGIVEVLAKTAVTLGAAGIIPILNLDNRLAGAVSESDPGAPMPCAVPEDSLVAALDATGAAWVRSYAHWPATEMHPVDAAVAAATVSNALLEGGLGVALALAAGAPRERCDLGVVN